MESRNRNLVRAILDRSPRSNLRMYELVDTLEEGEVHCYVNKSAILLVSWSTMLWAQREEDLIPLVKFIPKDQQETELFCVENRFIPLLEKHVAPGDCLCRVPYLDIE